MKIKITFTVDIDEGPDLFDIDLSSQVDRDIIDVLYAALEDNLEVEGYNFDRATITSEVSYA